MPYRTVVSKVQRVFSGLCPPQQAKGGGGNNKNNTTHTHTHPAAARASATAAEAEVPDRIDSDHDAD